MIFMLPALVFTNVFVVFILVFVNAAILFMIPATAFHGIVPCVAHLYGCNYEQQYLNILISQ